MARADLWSQAKGSIEFSVTTTARRFRLTDIREPGGGDLWRPWAAVAVDAQHLSGHVYVAFGGTVATASLATAVYDFTRTTFRQQGRTWELYASAATSVSILYPTGATSIFVELFRF